MSYVISINQNFARTLDEQAALRLAELSGTFAAFKYNLQDLPTRQEPRMFNIDHPFDWHTFDLFVGMFQPPGRLLDWAIDDVCEFVRLCHFFKVHENFLWHCLGISLPQECPSFFCHKQHVRCVVLPKVMWLPSDCETDYKHGGPVRCKL